MLRTTTIPLGLLVASCAPSLAHVAIDEYAATFACPPDAVRVTPRPDIAPHSLLHPTPPSEAVQDPLEQQSWEERVQLQKDYLDQFEVFDVAGCGRQVRWVCTPEWAGQVSRCDRAEAILP